MTAQDRIETASMLLGRVLDRRSREPLRDVEAAFEHLRTANGLLEELQRAA